MAFCGYLKQFVTVTISLGPFLDDDDALTEKTGLTIADTTIFLSKNGGAKANPNDTNDCTEDANGVYRKQLNSADTTTLGLLAVYVHEADALYVRQDYIVLPANVYDSLFSTDKLQVDMTQCGGSTVAAGAIPNAASDAAGGLPISDAGGLDLDAALAGIAAGSAIIPAGYVGDYKENGIVYFIWHTIVATSTDGTIKVYKNNGTDEVTVPTGIIDTRNFDSKTGVHLCSINLANSFYTKDTDYLVVLSGAVINGVTVNAVIATFSIEKRYQGLEWTKEG